ncbi:ATP-dependent Clp protease proteolytic subunit [Labrenzia sp. THAF35]|uniref:head maturation protease, ClpP-related n=1 Tax=Labrenzia sp. THAF35 TaxID=2587854 RepID=UPI0012688C22|nr:head maturation protease, ClpP-related [Labrenzia sp. THAF35]QFT69615.1 ATP-dependent Clp protease proteolytic subunit [Labrenzia sp. THAF35]
MDKIDFTAPLGDRRERFFARSVGTKFGAGTKRNEGGETQIDLYDEIGYWGVNAKRFRESLRGAGDIVLRVNSPGGDVFDGIAMYNDLVAHDGNVRVEVTGIAASIASIIAMAGDEITIAPNAFFMVHNAWTIGLGNRHDFEELAGVLAKIDDALARTYVSRTSTGIRSIKQMMDDETWLTAKEAIEFGFADKEIKVADDGAKAKFDLSVFGSVPDALKWPSDDSFDPETERDWERLVMQDAGYSRSKVRALKRVLKASSDADDTTQDAGVDLSKLAAAARELATI